VAAGLQQRFPGATGQPGCFAKHERRAGNNDTTIMNQPLKLTLAACAATLLASGALVWQLQAADADGPIKQVMKTYHKAPKGVDPVCKKASDGKASPTELKNMVAAYRTMAKARPPKGDDASWKDKCDKLLAGAEALASGAPDGLAKYKEAVNCKACHSAHKPD
jgi:hypothetical protein